MNALKQWEHWKELENLRPGSDRFVSRSATPRPEDSKPVPTGVEWSPLVDISEDPQEYLIKVELPEVKKEDVKVTAEEGALTIMGERKFEKQEKTRSYHRIERTYGSFGRTFSLPKDANPTRVRAEFKDGVLTVHLVKDEKPKALQVDVKIS